MDDCSTGEGNGTERERQNEDKLAHGRETASPLALLQNLHAHHISAGKPQAYARMDSRMHSEVATGSSEFWLQIFEQAWSLPVRSLRIGDLSRATDTKVETIRWYEKAGLLPRSARTQGNYRVFGSAELLRLQFIRRARDLGFSLDQVRKLLNLSGEAQSGCGSVHDTAREHIAEVDRKIASLTALRRELSQLSETCTGDDEQRCGILEALIPSRDDRPTH